MLKWLVIGISFTAGVAAQQADTAPPKPNDYADGKTWLCRPGRQDACAIDHTTTVVAADGKLSKETWTADPNAPIDCFYVYPTISTDPTPNSDMRSVLTGFRFSPGLMAFGPWSGPGCDTVM